MALRYAFFRATKPQNNYLNKKITVPNYELSFSIKPSSCIYYFLTIAVFLQDLLPLKICFLVLPRLF